MSAQEEWKWSVRHDRAIASLIEEETTREACRASGTTPTTMARWLRHPVFLARLDKERAEIWSATKVRLLGAATEAVGALQTTMRNDRAPWTARVAAARSLLSSAVRIRELELADKLDRLEGVIGNEDSADGEVLQ